MSELGKDLVFAGVDTHKDTHTLCLLDHMGRAIGTFGFAADAKGYDALAGKIGSPATCVGVGVEGTGSYGAGLTRRLLELGYCVYEVMVPEGRGASRAVRRATRPTPRWRRGRFSPGSTCRSPRTSPDGRKSSDSS